MSQVLHCDYENAVFDVNEFSDDQLWGKVHNRDPLHTIRGYVMGQAGGVDKNGDLIAGNVLGFDEGPIMQGDEAREPRG